MKSKILILVGVLLVALWLLSFKMKGGEETFNQLVGTRWIWEKTEMNDGSVVSPTKPGEYALTFNTDGTVFGDTDCNNFSGEYATGPGNKILLGSFMSTLMFCEVYQETEFSQAVSNSNQFLFTPDGNLVLNIKFDSGSVIFRKE